LTLNVCRRSCQTTYRTEYYRNRTICGWVI